MANCKTNVLRKITIVVVGCISGFTAAIAQDRMLIAEGVSPDLYINHKIAPKENYYSIGRLYNVPPKELAPFNNLEFDKGLSLGQDIKIPLSRNNFTQDGTLQAGEALIPVYHIVEAKEGLYRVSANYNKVPLQLLKKWNNLSSDAVSNGTKLIVGYLKVRKDQSSLSGNMATAVKDVPVAVKETGAGKKDGSVAKAVDDPARTGEAVKTAEAPNVQVKNKQAPNVKTEEAKAVPVLHTGISYNGGRFKDLYEEQHKGKLPVTENGLSGVFKSTSGWQDGKYYCFHNSAQPGTVFKITNSANNKTVYAKVLDLIPDISQNSGLILLISNSAAEELGISDSRFDCTISYYK